MCMHGYFLSPSVKYMYTMLIALGYEISVKKWWVYCFAIGTMVDDFEHLKSAYKELITRHTIYIYTLYTYLHTQTHMLVLTHTLHTHTHRIPEQG